MSVGDEKFIAITTYKRDGTPVTTPVWSVPLDGARIGFWTSSSSGTVTGPELEGIRAKVKAKYRVMVGVSKFGNKIGALVTRKKQPYGDRGVVVTLH